MTALAVLVGAVVIALSVLWSGHRTAARIERASTKAVQAAARAKHEAVRAGLIANADGKRWQD